VLFVALCSRDKGAFDAIAGVALANEAMSAEKSPLRFRLTLMGAFASDAEEKELRELANRPGLRGVIEIHGFVPAEEKRAALRDADVFCFPTYYLAESQPSNVIEAMAFGLPVVTTRWRAIPEMVSPDYPGLVDPKSPGQIADALRRLSVLDVSERLRERFLQRFTIEQHLAGMAAAFRSVEAVP
jgi:glycosyltransferase involved in cell wall biosynthesis